MARPFDLVSFDAFTPTGHGARFTDLFTAPSFPAHVARYVGRPPYMTNPAQQAHLRQRGDTP